MSLCALQNGAYVRILLEGPIHSVSFTLFYFFYGKSYFLPSVFSKKLFLKQALWPAHLLSIPWQRLMGQCLWNAFSSYAQIVCVKVNKNVWQTIGTSVVQIRHGSVKHGTSWLWGRQELSYAFFFAISFPVMGLFRIWHIVYVFLPICLIDNIPFKSIKWKFYLRENTIIFIHS